MSQFPNTLSRRLRRLMLKGSSFWLCPDPSSPQHTDLKPDPQLAGHLSQCRVLRCKKGHWDTRHLCGALGVDHAWQVEPGVLLPH